MTPTSAGYSGTPLDKKLGIKPPSRNTVKNILKENGLEPGPKRGEGTWDEATRTMWYEAVGKEKGQDPYFSHLYKVGLDGRNNVSLTPDNGTHTVQISPDGKYVVDTFSQPDVAPETTLRDGNTGALIMPLETA